MKFTLTLIFTLFLVGCGSPSVVDYSISAKDGRYNVRYLNEETSEFRFTATFKITEYSKEDEWPTTAAIGFFEGAYNESNTFQLAINKIQMADGDMLATFRVLEGGKQVLSNALIHYNSIDEITIDLSFKDGMVVIGINESKIEVDTDFKKVTPYVFVQSGYATFNIRT